MKFKKHPTIKQMFVATLNGVELNVSKSSFGWSCGCTYPNGSYVNVARETGALIYKTRSEAEHAVVAWVD